MAGLGAGSSAASAVPPTISIYHLVHLRWSLIDSTVTSSMILRLPQRVYASIRPSQTWASRRLGLDTHHPLGLNRSGRLRRSR